MCDKQQKDNTYPSLTLDTKPKSKWTTDLYIKPKTITLLEENIGENLCDFGLGKGFLDTTPKALSITFFLI